jgi:hypothetical protein
MPDFWEMTPKNLDSQLPSMHQREEQKIIAIRTIRNTFFDYWIVKKSIPYPHHTRIKMAS